MELTAARPEEFHISSDVEAADMRGPCSRAATRQRDLRLRPAAASDVGHALQQSASCLGYWVHACEARSAVFWPEPVHQLEVGRDREASCCRAYKLGKGRQSYNMLNVQLYDANNVSRRLEATHAARVSYRACNAPCTLSIPD